MNACKTECPFLEILYGHFWIYVYLPLIRLSGILYAGLELLLVALYILECLSNHYLF